MWKFSCFYVKILLLQCESEPCFFLRWQQSASVDFSSVVVVGFSNNTKCTLSTTTCSFAGWFWHKKLPWANPSSPSCRMTDHQPTAELHTKTHLIGLSVTYCGQVSQSHLALLSQSQFKVVRLLLLEQLNCVPGGKLWNHLHGINGILEYLTFSCSLMQTHTHKHKPSLFCLHLTFILATTEGEMEER